MLSSGVISELSKEGKEKYSAHRAPRRVCDNSVRNLKGASRRRLLVKVPWPQEAIVSVLRPIAYVFCFSCPA